MRKEYDFAAAERGKFYREDAEFCIPVYLDGDVAAFLRKIAARKGIQLDKLVNDWIRKEIRLVEDLAGVNKDE